MAIPHVGETESGEMFEQGTWSVAGHPFVVHYPPDLLRGLAAEAVEGLAAIPRGGIEVGGVLYGNHIGNAEITVIESRRLDCEYKLGPAFTLSPKDEQQLDELLRAPESDPSLVGLEAVGWFHSHTRSGIYLSGEDCSVHERFFPGALAGCAGVSARTHEAHTGRVLLPRGRRIHARHLELPRV